MSQATKSNSDSNFNSNSSSNNNNNNNNNNYSKMSQLAQTRYFKTVGFFYCTLLQLRDAIGNNSA